MLGLLLKDLYNLKGQLRIFFFLSLVAVFLAASTKSLESAQGILAMMTILIPLSAFAYDEFAKFDAYALTLPLARKDLVIAKYLLSFITMLIAFVIASLISFLLYTLLSDSFADMELKSVFLGQFLSFLVVYMLSTILYPFIFRFGSNNARIILISLVVSVGIILFLLFSLDISISGEVIAFIANNILWIGIVLALVIFVLSLMISIRIMNKREF